MKPFAGFPAGKTRFTPIPDLFYTELLSSINDLAELKVTLYMFWSLNRQRGYPRYLTIRELEGEGLLLSSLRSLSEPDPLSTLHQAIEKAVARGTLLRLSVSDDGEREDYLFLNTPQGRKAVEQVTSGDLILEKKGLVREVHVERPRPRIFELYEQNIGLLQPLLAEELEEAERAFPADWIADAFKIAAEHNVRKWRYIKSILERWARDGKDDSDAPFYRRGRRSRFASRGRRP